MAVFDENWQKVKANIRERSVFMFNNDLLSDIKLVVRASSSESEPKKFSKMAIPAHKFVLSVCSPVFFAMFYGEMAEKSDSIDLPDCEYEGVLEMLRYLYSGEVKLNENNVMQVLYAAKKYILPSLADECIEFLQRNLDPTNVFCVLSHAQQYDEKNVVDRCWEMIDRKTEEVVKSEGFTTIERSLLEAVVKRDSVTIEEVELFKAVDLWATKECERQGLAKDGSVKRRILGKQIVQALRFPAMEEKEFASVVLDCNILTKEEVCDLMKNFNGVLTTPVGFPEDRRGGSYLSCCRFQLFLRKGRFADGWPYDCTSNDCISFSVDKDVMLHGIRLFGSKNKEYAVSMEVKDLQNKETLYVLEEETFSSVPLAYKDEKIDGFDVLFGPLVLRKDNDYVVKADINGPDSAFGTKGDDVVQCHGVTFNFANYRSKRIYNETSVACGQFAEFFFKLL